MEKEKQVQTNEVAKTTTTTTATSPAIEQYGDYIVFAVHNARAVRIEKSE